MEIERTFVQCKRFHECTPITITAKDALWTGYSL